MIIGGIALLAVAKKGVEYYRHCQQLKRDFRPIPSENSYGCSEEIDRIAEINRIVGHACRRASTSTPLTWHCAPENRLLRKKTILESHRDCESRAWVQGNRWVGGIIYIPHDEIDESDARLTYIVLHERVHVEKNHLLKREIFDCASLAGTAVANQLMSTGLLSSCVIIGACTVLHQVTKGLYIRSQEAEADGGAAELSTEEELQAAKKYHEEVRDRRVEIRQTMGEQGDFVGQYLIKPNGDFLLAYHHPYTSARIDAFDKNLTRLRQGHAHNIAPRVKCTHTGDIAQAAYSIYRDVASVVWSALRESAASYIQDALYFPKALLIMRRPVGF